MTGHLILLSGGLDSTVLATEHSNGRTHGLAIDYGQRHRRELAAADAIAQHLQITFAAIDISDLGQHLAETSALTGNADVPDGHYADDAMNATVVPNRNAVLLSIAASYAVAHDLTEVLTATHAGDRSIYPDCRPAFLDAIDHATRLGTAGFGDIRIRAPYRDMTKADIVRLGHRLNAPLHLTWSCYRGEATHCGRCGTCVERHEAFRHAGIPDPTTYRDPHYAAEVAP